MKCCCAVAAIALALAVQARAEEAFSKRADEFVHRIAGVKITGNRTVNFAVITARIKTGVEVSDAYRWLDSLLDHPGEDMFYMYSSMGCFLNLRNVLSDSLAQKFRAAWRDYTFYRGDTENHFLMYYAGLYLASQTWRGLGGAQWFNGKSSDENFAEARRWILQWIETTAREGQIEFDSPRYMYYYLTPLFLLCQFADSPAMRMRAQLTLDLLFADFAAEYLHGSYCGAHSRDAELSAIEPRTAETISYAALYFGDVDVSQPMPDVAFAALTPYRLPEIIRDIALNKPHAEVHVETKRARNHIRYGGEKNPLVFKYDFITPEFILGSMQGGIAQPIQQRSWALTFNSGKRMNQIFGLHPTFSARELATFFPEEPALMVGDIGKAKTGYTSEDKWIGGASDEHIYQSKNVLIALYDIATNDPVQHIDVFLPKSLDTIDRTPTGWIFIRNGEAFAAVYMLRGCRWIDEGNYYRLRSGARKNGYIIVASSSRLRPPVTTFAQFKRQIVDSPVDTAEFSRNGSVAFGYAHRAPVVFSFGASPARDSSLFADSEFGAFRRSRSVAPHIFSRRGSGVVTIESDTESLVLDFTADAIHAAPRREGESPYFKN